MSYKFGKNHSVDRSYLSVPMYYTGIKHTANKDKELVLIDDMGKHYIAAYRNNELCKVGITFLLKKEYKNNTYGFIFKDKFHPLGNRVL